MNKSALLLKVIHAVSETIRECSPVPAGTVYAALMTQGCTIGQFDQIIGILEGAEVVKRSNDLLTWIGPAIPT